MIEGQALKDKVLHWVQECRRGRPEDVGYAISAGAPDPTIMSLCFAVLIAELYDGIPDDHLQERWRQALISVQDAETGLFIDPLLFPDDLKFESPGMDYLIHQTTYFALNALDALAARPLHPLRFADPYCDPAYLEEWLEGLDWSNPWRESNWVMFIAASLYVKWQWEDSHAAWAALHRLLDWLDTHQDPETGFWGVGQGASLLHAMAGAYHFLPFYFCLGRSPHYPERMIESTLSLQQPDGLFNPEGGGDACLDGDAIGILALCSLITSHKTAQVESALEHAFYGVFDNQSEEGGFCRARLRPLPRKTWKRRMAETLGLDRLLHRPYQVPRQIEKYEGWNRMSYDIRQPDLWSTWFRSHSLALISARFPRRIIDGIEWRFRRLPSLGWFDRDTIMYICRTG